MEQTPRPSLIASKSHHGAPEVRYLYNPLRELWERVPRPNPVRRAAERALPHSASA